MKSTEHRYSLVATLLAVAAATTLSGCSSETDFRLNYVHMQVQEKTTGVALSDRQHTNLKEVLEAYFGTPDEPRVPQLDGVDLSGVLDIRKLKMAAGPVGRNEAGRKIGLYREHCGHCHGVTGDGAGPTAKFLNPYPRDFRRGLFKFKSTARTTPPTTEDLHRILDEGIPDTAMPSFRLLPENEREALVHYVRYLAIRGEVERLLIFEYVDTVDEGSLLFDPAAEGDSKAEQLDLVRGVTSEIAEKWLTAPDDVVPVPPRPDRPLAETIPRGRDLFFGAVANCVKCHGPTAIGDGVTDDFDEWSKELVDKQNPTAHEEWLRRYVANGALEPRPMKPRNLRTNAYRGGRRPIDLYWRIHNGIAGTPMPAASMKQADAPPEAKGLTADDVWCLIDYVRSLPYDSLSRAAAAHGPTNQRERQ